MTLLLNVGVQESHVLRAIPHEDKGRKKSNKLNFLWPKMPRLGPLFDPKNPPEKVYVGPFLASFLRK